MRIVKSSIKNTAAIDDVSYRTYDTEICQDLNQHVLDDPTFMSKVIAGDETWVYRYDLETKQQSSQWKSPTPPQPKKARQIIGFFDIHGVVHREFVPWGQIINGKFYCNVFRRLRQDVRWKQPELWREGNWMLHDDNAPSH